jgi:hypothetical protein
MGWYIILTQLGCWARADHINWHFQPAQTITQPNLVEEYSQILKFNSRFTSASTLKIRRLCTFLERIHAHTHV